MQSKILSKHKALLEKKHDLNLELTVLENKLNQLRDSNAYITLTIKQAKKQVTNFVLKHDELLSGIFYTIKDNIVTKDIVTTGGSKFLENYVPPFNATCYQLLEDAGAINLAKTNLDEFGLGGTGLLSGFGDVYNPWNANYITSGSSSGAAFLLAKEIGDFSIGTDTGDSVRAPASFCGVVGYKPSYGLISRYGVYPFCPSLDTVGILAHYVGDVAIVLSSIAQYDYLDATSLNLPKKKYYLDLDLPLSESLRMGFLSNTFWNYEANEKWNSKIVKEQFNQFLELLKTQYNINIAEHDFNNDYLKAIHGLYRIIGYGDAASCYANMTGITFGQKLNDDDFTKAIIKNRNLFQTELKKRFVVGAYVTSELHFEELFMRAKKIRTLILEEIQKLFEKVDIIILPSAIGTPLKVEEAKNNIDYEPNNIVSILQICNFGGLPSITIPWIKINQMPVGLNIFANFNCDHQLLKVANHFEKIIKMQQEQ